MSSSDDLAGVLSPGAADLVERVRAEAARAGLPEPGVSTWLHALSERYGPLLESLCPDLRVDALQRNLEASLSGGDRSEPLPKAVVVDEAVAHAQGRGRQVASERDVAAVVLAHAGYEFSVSAEMTTPVVSTSAAGAERAAEGEGSEPAGGYRPRTARPTPTLDEFGRDLTSEALRGQLWDIVGRDVETQLLVETLCRRTKRNPLLVGPAGVGKTAIVEGFAQRVVRGDVPAPLRDVRVIALQPSALIAGASMAGEFEKRVRAALHEARQDGVVLFIDEVHSLIGAGGRVGTTDAASLVKPALARGDLACIAATTDDEFRLWIESDSALERRFQPIRVQELGIEENIAVVRSVRDALVELRGVAVPDEVVEWLVRAAERHLRNRYLPDSAIDLLEQSVAYAIVNGLTSVDRDVAETVLTRVLGLPGDLTDVLGRLPAQLAEEVLLHPEDAEEIAGRLAVTTRGLDIRPTRPNAVVLLADKAAGSGAALAEVLAREICGSEGRTVSIDLSRLVNAEDVTVLVGAPPGYVGYSDHLAIHRLAQVPWSVLLLHRIDACHPRVLDVVTQALAEGFFTDGTGKRLFLSDAIVIMTASVEVRGSRAFGFTAEANVRTERATAQVAEAVGAGIAEQCDIIIAAVSSAISPEGVRCQRLLNEVAERYRQRGLHVSWDASAVTWLNAKLSALPNRLDRERFLDEHVAAILLAHLPNNGGEEVRVTVRCSDERIAVERTGASGKGA